MRRVVAGASALLILCGGVILASCGGAHQPFTVPVTAADVSRFNGRYLGTWGTGGTIQLSVSDGQITATIIDGSSQRSDLQGTIDDSGVITIVSATGEGPGLSANGQITSNQNVFTAHGTWYFVATPSQTNTWSATRQ